MALAQTFLAPHRNEALLSEYCDRFGDDVTKQWRQERRDAASSEHLFQRLITVAGDLSAALVQNDVDFGVTGSNEVYYELIRLGALAVRLATEGDPAFPNYRPGEVDANVGR